MSSQFTCPRNTTTDSLLKSKFLHFVMKLFRRDEIMEIIKRAYLEIFNKNLPVYGVPSKDLRDFTTTEKDLKKSVSRFPLPEMRLMGEDLLKVTAVDDV